MHKEEFTFKYPDITYVAKKDTDVCIFTDCDFFYVKRIFLSGFKKVLFEEAYVFPNDCVSIDIQKCEKVIFRQVSMTGTPKANISLKNVKNVTFYRFEAEKQLDLQTQNCESISFYGSSLLNFDTSKIIANKLEISDTQISDMKELNLMNISQQVKVTNTQFFDSGKLLVRAGVHVSERDCLDIDRNSHDIQRLIIRRKYEAQQQVR